ncbi:alcohol dehydrogenase catalytic domain-containing protein, partial [candidate division KSB1 bacterium]|nr:alcohol dehydrogenase catalytic domain-containing protein [candidate division KSB1 bacterium]
MRQIYIAKYGGPKVLEIRSSADPKPGPGEVLIDVKASGINFADILARKGVYPDAPKAPCVVGYEVAGDIEAVGNGVDKKLIGTPALAITRFGGYSDKVVIGKDQFFPKPSEISYEQAASIPVAYLTAYQLVV